MKRHQLNQKKSIAAAQHAVKKSRGDTLIEVLVTFFIISVGVLGASSMQIAALQNLNGSSYRDQAVIITENLAESMRAMGPTNDPNDYAALIASYQLEAATLPSGGLDAVVLDPLNPGRYTITVRWDEDRNDSRGINCPVTSAADLDCHQIIFSP
jgi:Prokaryotic N-terminal methylation motif